MTTEIRVSQLPTVSASGLDATSALVLNDGGVTSTITAQNLATALGAINVKMFGAVGDGVTDDRVAIQAALTAANAAGGGVVFLPTGTYIVSVAAHPSNANHFAGLLIGSNVSLVGAGRDATTIKLKASQTGGSASGNSSVIYNLSLSGNANIRISDLTIDGNNVNQSTAVHNGITLYVCQDCIVERVTSKNCQGLLNSGYQETGQFFSATNSRLTYRDCWAVRTAGDTAAGFSNNAATYLVYDRCVANGMTKSGGMGAYGSSHVYFTNCASYLNFTDGFHFEQTVDVMLANCVGGGTATSSTSAGFSASQDLGNTSAGFGIILSCQRFTLVGCQAINNNIGVQTDASTQLVFSGCDFMFNAFGTLFQSSSSGIVTGCSIAWSGTVGIGFVDNASAQAFRMTNNQFTSNAVDISAPLIGSVNGTGWTYANVVPATTVAYTNPFGADCTVHIVGGTVTVIAVNGVATGLTAGTVRVPARCTITLTYTVAPTWKWFLD